jgi:hypothetical protein
MTEAALSMADRNWQHLGRTLPKSPLRLRLLPEYPSPHSGTVRGLRSSSKISLSSSKPKKCLPEARQALTDDPVPVLKSATIDRLLEQASIRIWKKIADFSRAPRHEVPALVKTGFRTEFRSFRNLCGSLEVLARSG